MLRSPARQVSDDRKVLAGGIMQRLRCICWSNQTQFIICMQTLPRKRKRSKRTRCKCGSTEHLTSRSLQCALNKNYKPSLVEVQIRTHEASAAAAATASASSSATASTTITEPVIDAQTENRSTILGSDPELNTVKKFNQDLPYSPFHPHLNEVQGATAQKYDPMHIPPNMQHKACFSFSSLPNAPATAEPDDVIPFLNETFIPDEFAKLIYKKTLEYIAFQKWPKPYKVSLGDIFQFFAIVYYMGFARMPSKEDY